MISPRRSFYMVVFLLTVFVSISQARLAIPGKLPRNTVIDLSEYCPPACVGDACFPDPPVITITVDPVDPKIPVPVCVIDCDDESYCDLNPTDPSCILPPFCQREENYDHAACLLEPICPLEPTIDQTECIMDPICYDKDTQDKDNYPECWLPPVCPINPPYNVTEDGRFVDEDDENGCYLQPLCPTEPPYDTLANGTVITRESHPHCYEPPICPTREPYNITEDGRTIEEHGACMVPPICPVDEPYNITVDGRTIEEHGACMLPPICPTDDPWNTTVDGRVATLEAKPECWVPPECPQQSPWNITEDGRVAEDICFLDPLCPTEYPYDTLANGTVITPEDMPECWLDPACPIEEPWDQLADGTIITIESHPNCFEIPECPIQEPWDQLEDGTVITEESHPQCFVDSVCPTEEPYTSDNPDCFLDPVCPDEDNDACTVDICLYEPDNDLCLPQKLCDVDPTHWKCSNDLCIATNYTDELCQQPYLCDVDPDNIDCQTDHICLLDPTNAKCTDTLVCDTLDEDDPDYIELCVSPERCPEGSTDELCQVTAKCPNDDDEDCLSSDLCEDDPDHEDCVAVNVCNVNASDTSCLVTRRCPNDDDETCAVENICERDPTLSECTVKVSLCERNPDHADCSESVVNCSREGYEDHEGCQAVNICDEEPDNENCTTYKPCAEAGDTNPLCAAKMGPVCLALGLCGNTTVAGVEISCPAEIGCGNDDANVYLNYSLSISENSTITTRIVTERNVTVAVTGPNITFTETSVLEGYEMELVFEPGAWVEFNGTYNASSNLNMTTGEIHFIEPASLGIGYILLSNGSKVYFTNVTFESPDLDINMTDSDLDMSEIAQNISLNISISGSELNLSDFANPVTIGDLIVVDDSALGLNTGNLVTINSTLLDGIINGTDSIVTLNLTMTDGVLGVNASVLNELLLAGDEEKILEAILESLGNASLSGGDVTFADGAGLINEGDMQITNLTFDAEGDSTFENRGDLGIDDGFSSRVSIDSIGDIDVTSGSLTIDANFNLDGNLTFEDLLAQLNLGDGNFSFSNLSAIVGGELNIFDPDAQIVVEGIFNMSDLISFAMGNLTFLNSSSVRTNSISLGGNATLTYYGCTNLENNWNMENVVISDNATLGFYVNDPLVVDWLVVDSGLASFTDAGQLNFTGIKLLDGGILDLSTGSEEPLEFSRLIVQGGTRIGTDTMVVEDTDWYYGGFSGGVTISGTTTFYNNMSDSGVKVLNGTGSFVIMDCPTLTDDVINGGGEATLKINAGGCLTLNNSLLNRTDGQPYLANLGTVYTNQTSESDWYLYSTGAIEVTDLFTVGGGGWINDSLLINEDSTIQFEEVDENLVVFTTSASITEQSPSTSYFDIVSPDMKVFVNGSLVYGADHIRIQEGYLYVGPDATLDSERLAVGDGGHLVFQPSSTVASAYTTKEVELNGGELKILSGIAPQLNFVDLTAGAPSVRSGDGDVIIEDLNIFAGTFEDDGMTNVTGTLLISGDDSKFWYDNAIVIAEGELVWDATGPITGCSTGGLIIDTGVTAVINNSIQALLTEDCEYDPYIINNGEFSKTTADSADIDWKFYSHGSINVNGGDLQLGNSGNVTTTLNIESDASVTFDSDENDVEFFFEETSSITVSSAGSGKLLLNSSTSDLHLMGTMVLENHFQVSDGTAHIHDSSDFTLGTVTVDNEGTLQIEPMTDRSHVRSLNTLVVEDDAEVICLTDAVLEVDTVEMSSGSFHSNGGEGVTIATDFDYSGGILAEQFIEVTDGFTATSGSAKNMTDEVYLILDGTDNTISDTITGSCGAVIYVKAGATLVLDDGANLLWDTERCPGEPPVLHIEGTLIKRGTLDAESTVEWKIINDGTIQVESDILNVAGGGLCRNDSSTNVECGAQLLFSSTRSALFSFNENSTLTDAHCDESDPAIISMKSSDMTLQLLGDVDTGSSIIINRGHLKIDAAANLQADKITIGGSELFEDCEECSVLFANLTGASVVTNAETSNYNIDMVSISNCSTTFTSGATIPFIEMEILDGVVTGTDTVEIETLTFEGGVLSGEIDLHATSKFNGYGSTAKYMIEDSSITIESEGEWAGTSEEGILYGCDSATLVNKGTFVVKDYQTFELCETTVCGWTARPTSFPTFINEGIYQKPSTSAMETVLNWAVDNSGTIDLDSSSLTFGAGIESSGTLELADEAAVYFDSECSGVSNFTSTSDITKTGSLGVGTFDVIDAAGDVYVNGVFDLDDGLHITMGAVHFGDGATVIIDAASVDGSGLLHFAPVSGASPAHQVDQFIVKGGELRLESGRDLSFNSLTISGGKRSGDDSLDVQNFAFSGGILVDDGEIVVNNYGEISGVSTKNITDGASIINKMVFDIKSPGFIYMTDSARIENEATMTVLSTNTRIYGCSSDVAIENKVGGTFNIEERLYLLPTSDDCFCDGPVIINAGVLDKITDEPLINEWRFENEGTLDLHSGDYIVSGGGVSSAAWNLHGDTNVVFRMVQSCRSDMYFTDSSSVNEVGSGNSFVIDNDFSNVFVDGVYSVSTGTQVNAGELHFTGNSTASAGDIVVAGGSLIMEETDTFKNHVNHNIEAITLQSGEIIFDLKSVPSYDSITQDAGLIDGTGTFTTDSLTINDGTINGSLTITASELFTWESGSIHESTSITSGGVGSITTGGSKTILDASTITNAATGTLTIDSISVISGCGSATGIINEGTLIFGTTVQLELASSCSELPSLINSGDITKDVDTTAVLDGWMLLHQSGTITLAAGRLNIYGGGQSDSTIEYMSETEIHFKSPQSPVSDFIFTSTSSLTTTGTDTIVTLDSAETVVTVDGNWITADGVILTTGTLEMDSNSLLDADLVNLYGGLMTFLPTDLGTSQHDIEAIVIMGGTINLKSGETVDIATLTLTNGVISGTDAITSQSVTLSSGLVTGSITLETVNLVTQTTNQLVLNESVAIDAQAVTSTDEKTITTCGPMEMHIRSSWTIEDPLDLVIENENCAGIPTVFDHASVTASADVNSEWHWKVLGELEIGDVTFHLDGGLESEGTVTLTDGSTLELGKTDKLVDTTSAQTILSAGSLLRNLPIENSSDIVITNADHVIHVQGEIVVGDVIHLTQGTIYVEEGSSVTATRILIDSDASLEFSSVLSSSVSPHVIDELEISNFADVAFLTSHTTFAIGMLDLIAANVMTTDNLVVETCDWQAGNFTGSGHTVCNTLTVHTTANKRNLDTHHLEAVETMLMMDSFNLYGSSGSTLSTNTDTSVGFEGPSIVFKDAGLFNVEGSVNVNSSSLFSIEWTVHQLSGIFNVCDTSSVLISQDATVDGTINIESGSTLTLSDASSTVVSSSGYISGEGEFDVDNAELDVSGSIDFDGNADWSAMNIVVSSSGSFYVASGEYVDVTAELNSLTRNEFAEMTATGLSLVGTGDIVISGESSLRGHIIVGTDTTVHTLDNTYLDVYDDPDDPMSTIPYTLDVSDGASFSIESTDFAADEGEINIGCNADITISAFSTVLIFENSFTSTCGDDAVLNVLGSLTFYQGSSLIAVRLNVEGEFAVTDVSDVTITHNTSISGDFKVITSGKLTLGTTTLVFDTFVLSEGSLLKINDAQIEFGNESAVVSVLGALDLTDAVINRQGTFDISNSATFSKVQSSIIQGAAVWSIHDLSAAMSITSVAVNSNAEFILNTGHVVVIEGFTIDGGERSGSDTLNITSSFAWVEAGFRGSGSTNIQSGATTTVMRLYNEDQYSYILEGHTFTIEEAALLITAGTLNVTILGDGTSEMINYGTITTKVDSDFQHTGTGDLPTFWNYGTVKSGSHTEDIVIEWIVRNNGTFTVTSHNWFKSGTEDGEGTINILADGQFGVLTTNHTMHYDTNLLGKDSFMYLNPTGTALRTGGYVCLENVELIGQGIFELLPGYRFCDESNIIPRDVTVVFPEDDDTPLIPQIEIQQDWCHREHVYFTQSFKWINGSLLCEGVFESMNVGLIDAIGPLGLGDETTLLNTGTMTFESGDIEACGDALFQNDGELIVKKDTSLTSDASCNATFVNNGTLRIQATDGEFTVGFKFTNLPGATVIIESGTLKLTSETTLDGSVELLGGALDIEDTDEITYRADTYADGGLLTIPEGSTLEVQGGVFDSADDYLLPLSDATLMFNGDSAGITGSFDLTNATIDLQTTNCTSTHFNVLTINTDGILDSQLICPTTVDTLHMLGGLRTGPGPLTIQTLDFQSGSFEGPADNEIASEATFTTSNAKIFADSTLVMLSGSTSTVTTCEITLTNTELSIEGTLNLVSATLTSDTAVSASGDIVSTGASFIASSLTSVGAITVSTGTLALIESQLYKGSLYVNSGATLDVQTDIRTENFASITNNGVVEITSGDVNVFNTIISGTGCFKVHANQSLDISGSTVNAMQLCDLPQFASMEITNSSIESIETTVTGGSLDMDNSFVNNWDISISAGLIMSDFATISSLLITGSGGQVSLHSEIDSCTTNSLVDTTLSFSSSNTTQLTLNSVGTGGMVSLNSGSTTSKIAVNSMTAGTVAFNSNSTAKIDTVTMSGGSLEVNSDSITDWSDSTIVLDGANAALTFSDGTDATSTVDNMDIAVTNGVVTFEEFAFDASGVTSLKAQGNAFVLIANKYHDAESISLSDTATLLVTGSIDISNTLTAQDSSNVTITETATHDFSDLSIELTDSATFYLADGVEYASTCDSFTISDSALASIDDELQCNTIVLNAGTLSGSGNVIALNSFIYHGGALNGNSVMQVEGAALIDTAATKTITDRELLLKSGSSTSLTDATFSMENSTITVETGAGVSSSGTTINAADNNALIDIDGTFNQKGSTGSTISVPVSLTGVLLVTQAELVVDSLTSTGVSDISAELSVTNYALFAPTSTTTVSGLLSLDNAVVSVNSTTVFKTSGDGKVVVDGSTLNFVDDGSSSALRLESLNTAIVNVVDNAVIDELELLSCYDTVFSVSSSVTVKSLVVHDDCTLTTTGTTDFTNAVVTVDGTNAVVDLTGGSTVTISDTNYTATDGQLIMSPLSTPYAFNLVEISNNAAISIANVSAISANSFTISDSASVSGVNHTLTAAAVNWNGGSLSGADSQMVATTSLSIDSETTRSIGDDYTVINEGECSHTGGTIIAGLRSVILNKPTGVWTNPSQAAINPVSTDSDDICILQNQGTFIKDGSGVRTELTIGVENSGLFQIVSGTIALGTASWSSGQFVLENSDATLELTGEFWFKTTSEVTGPGNLLLSATTSDVHLSGDFGLTGDVQVDAGRLEGYTGLSVNSMNLKVTGGVVDFGGAVALPLLNVMACASGELLFNSGSDVQSVPILNIDDCTVRIMSNSTTSMKDTAITITGAGTLISEAGSSTDWTDTTINMSDGVLKLEKNSTSGDMPYFSEIIMSGGQFTPEEDTGIFYIGNFEMSGGVRDGTSDIHATTLSWTGGEFTGATETWALDSMVFDSADVRALSEQHTLVNNGTAKLAGGTINAGKSTTIWNTEHGSMELTGEIIITPLFTGDDLAVLLNDGDLSKQGVTDVNLLVSLHSTGDITITEGLLSTGIEGWSSGLIDVSAGSVLEFAGPFQFNSSSVLSGEGEVRLNHELCDIVLGGNVISTGPFRVVKGHLHTLAGITLDTLTLIVETEGKATLDESSLVRNLVSGECSGELIVGPEATIAQITYFHGDACNFTVLDNSFITSTSGTLSFENSSLLNSLKSSMHLESATMSISSSSSVSFDSDSTLEFISANVLLDNAELTIVTLLADASKNMVNEMVAIDSTIDLGSNTLYIVDANLTTTALIGAANISLSDAASIVDVELSGSGNLLASGEDIHIYTIELSASGNLEIVDLGVCYVLETITLGDSASILVAGTLNLTPENPTNSILYANTSFEHENRMTVKPTGNLIFEADTSIAVVLDVEGTLSTESSVVGTLLETTVVDGKLSLATGSTISIKTNASLTANSAVGGADDSSLVVDGTSSTLSVAGDWTTVPLTLISSTAVAQSTTNAPVWTVHGIGESELLIQTSNTMQLIVDLIDTSSATIASEIALDVTLNDNSHLIVAEAGTVSELVSFTINDDAAFDVQADGTLHLDNSDQYILFNGGVSTFDPSSVITCADATFLVEAGSLIFKTSDITNPIKTVKVTGGDFNFDSTTVTPITSLVLNGSTAVIDSSITLTVEYLHILEGTLNADTTTSTLTLESDRTALIASNVMLVNQMKFEGDDVVSTTIDGTLVRPASVVLTLDHPFLVDGAGLFVLYGNVSTVEGATDMQFTVATEIKDSYLDILSDSALHLRNVVVENVNVSLQSNGVLGSSTSDDISLGFTPFHLPVNCTLISHQGILAGRFESSGYITVDETLDSTGDIILTDSSELEMNLWNESSYERIEVVGNFHAAGEFYMEFDTDSSLSTNAKFDFVTAGVLNGTFNEIHGLCLFNFDFQYTAQVFSAVVGRPITDDLGIKVYVDPTSEDTVCCGDRLSPCRTFTTALSHATDSDTIVLMSGTYTFENDELPFDFKARTISVTSDDMDDPAVVDCGSTGSVAISFNNANNVKLSNIAIQNCKHAVKISNAQVSISNISMENVKKGVTIKSATATISNLTGTGIEQLFVDVKDANVVIDGIELTDSDISSGGVVVKRSTVSISDAIVADIPDTQNGAFLTVTSSTVSVDCMNASNVHASSDGGLIYTMDSTINIDCSETDARNTFTNISTSGRGGSIYAYRATVAVSNSDFLSNSADKTGGVLYSDMTGVTLRYVNVLDAQVAVCECDGVLDCTGGAFAVNRGQFLTIESSVFVDTGACDRGGVGYISNTPTTITDSSFENSTASQGGALYVTVQSNLTIENSTFSNNTATTSGGAIKVVDSEASVTNSTFSENTAETSDGGAISVTSPSSTSFSSNLNSFGSNSADEGSGGAIYITANNVFDLLSSVFNNNSAKYGGAVATESYECASDAVLQSSDCVFDNNTASIAGGAIYANATVTINPSSYTGEGNEAGEFGTDVASAPIQLYAEVGTIYVVNEATLELEDDDEETTDVSTNDDSETTSEDPMELVFYVADAFDQIITSDYGRSVRLSAVNDSCVLSGEISTTVIAGYARFSSFGISGPNGDCQVLAQADDLASATGHIYVENICPAGMGHNGLECEVCAVGHYSDTLDDSSCALCPAGTWASGTGSSSCEACPAGYYRSTVWEVGCTECGDDYYTSEEGSLTCEECPTLSTPNSNHTKCVCLGGFIGEEPPDCLPCPSGSQCLGSGVDCITEGYWKSQPHIVSTDSATQCHSFGCPGTCDTLTDTTTVTAATETDADELCGTGYEGSACHTCSEGFTRVDEYCDNCEEISPIVKYGQAILFAGVWGVAIFTAIVGGIIPVILVRNLLRYTQMLGLLAFASYMPVDEILRRFLAWCRSVSLDPFVMPLLSCKFSIPAMAYPIFGLLYACLMFLFWFSTNSKHAKSETAEDKLGRLKRSQIMLTILEMLLLPALYGITQPLSCWSVESETITLGTHTMQCYTSVWKLSVFVSVIALLILGGTLTWVFMSRRFGDSGNRAVAEARALDVAEDLVFAVGIAAAFLFRSNSGFIPVLLGMHFITITHHAFSLNFHLHISLFVLRILYLLATIGTLLIGLANDSNPWSLPMVIVHSILILVSIITAIILRAALVRKSTPGLHSQYGGLHPNRIHNPFSTLRARYLTSGSVSDGMGASMGIVPDTGSQYSEEWSDDLFLPDQTAGML